MLERVNIHLEILYRLDIVSRYQTFNINNNTKDDFIPHFLFAFYSDSTLVFL